MKIKLDENIPSGLVDQLGLLGHDVHTVPQEKLTGSDDQRVWEKVQKEHRFFKDALPSPPKINCAFVIHKSRRPSSALDLNPGLFIDAHEFQGILSRPSDPELIPGLGKVASSGAPVNAQGCSGAQLITQACPGTASFKNHGQYVSCVTHAADRAVAQGLISSQEKGRFVREAAHAK